MSKGLNALKEIKKCMVQNCDYADYYKEFEIIEKELKAFKIINEKTIDIFQLRIAIMLNNLDEYNKRHAEWCKLTQEEFDLLKEVLL